VTFGQLTALGIAVAMVGFSLQVVYLPQSIRDLRITWRKTRATLAATATEAEREAARRDGRTQVFYVSARIVSSVALMTVHVLIVSTIALVLQAVRTTTPSPTAFNLAWIRVAVSGVVIVATTSQLAARYWALRR
jgi:hypothetical protein